jgi:phosphomannomutase
MTEEFFELYCYAHVHDLIKRKLMGPGREIVIGWDPRDPEGTYTSRAVAGIAKAGGRPLVAGTLPTPGVALMLVSRRAAGAFVITASHNPKDQNGIKIFLAPNAMKPLPEQDAALTEVIFNLEWADVKNCAPKYEPLYAEEDAGKLFLDFHMDARNSWLPEGKSLFSNVTLIVDPARGALAGIAAEFFKRVGFGEVVEVADERDGRVNEECGAAFLEGFREISGASLKAEPRLAGHELVKKMFETGRERGEFTKDRKLIGVSFDADGDRFYILVYSASDDTVHVLSGDETAALQGEYLMKTDPERYRGTMFVHTVESDINVSRHANRLGFSPVLTGVGDKWILQKALGGGRFGIGLEETGHSIHQGYAATGGGGETVFYAGNGLKGAINTLVSITALYKDAGAENFIRSVKAPFEPGFKRSAPAYYVDKPLFARGTDVWNGVKEMIYESFKEADEPDYSLEEAEMEHEPDMLFIKMVHKTDGLVGTLFARNSGTEEKASVYVRGPRELEAMLTVICEDSALYMMKKMKNLKNPMAAAETAVLEKLSREEKIDRDAFKEIDLDRLLFEMEIKQKLIKRYGSDCSLTRMGRRFVD